MSCRTLAALILTAFAPFCQAQAVTVWDYLDQQASQLSEALPPLADTVPAWEAQRAETVAELTAVLGLPKRQPMKASVTDMTRKGGLVYEEIVYRWADETYASATLIRQDGESSPRPAVVFPSGWLGHHSFRSCRPLVEALANQGLAVLFVDDVRTGKRQSPRAGLYATASAAGIPVAGIQVFDALRALDYLTTRADIEAGKIGIAGVDQGGLQAYLAAALEPRFQFVIAVNGTTTYKALVESAGPGQGPEDPSAYVPGVLRFTDLDRIAACIAPRPVLLADAMRGGVWPASGRMLVLRTLRTVYGLYDSDNKIHSITLRPTADQVETADDIANWLSQTVLPSLPVSGEPPAACETPESVNLDMLLYLQARIADAASGDLAAAIAWLRDVCGVDRLQPGPNEVLAVETADGVVVEQLVLGVDGDFRCPALLIHGNDEQATPRPGVILSHSGRSCSLAAEVMEAARQLAAAGHWVIVPDHASVHRQSQQPLSNPEEPSFYGDEASRFYGPADAVGAPPLALRTMENLAAFRYLSGRAEVNTDQIAITGSGVGALDACLTALLEPRIAGVAAVDVTTVRDWSVEVAPGQSRFFHWLPCLPGQSARADWDQWFAAVAPRPLTVVRLKDGWPESGFDRVAQTSAASYAAAGAPTALLALGPRDVTDQLMSSVTDATQRQLIAAARVFVPAPPQPGRVGSPDGLKPRRSIDSAAGIVWLIAEMDGYDQEFVDGGYRLKSWSWFNDNGAEQAGRAVTPLIFRQQDDAYELIGIGATRTNDGTGKQTYAFDVVQGVDTVGEGCFFGWHTGDGQGKHNPGVIEYEDAPDAQVMILTLDGQMTGQRLDLGGNYRRQAQFPRRYSIMAESAIPVSE